MSRKKLRPLGHTLIDLEKLLLEMCVDHDMQWGDVLNLVRGYMEVHVPGAQEQYDAGGNPIFYYGPPKSETKPEGDVE